MALSPVEEQPESINCGKFRNISTAISAVGVTVTGRIKFSL